MVDLNLWRLKYPGVDFEFGTHESGYPFTKQVDVGAVQLETNDLDHPLSDGLVFGVDILRGRTLNFAGAHHLPLRTPKHYRHERPLDLGNALLPRHCEEDQREAPRLDIGAAHFLQP